jgi:hypothetical protein
VFGLSQLRPAHLAQAGLRFDHTFGGLGVFTHVEVRSCLVQSPVLGDDGLRFINIKLQEGPFFYRKHPDQKNEKQSDPQIPTGIRPTCRGALADGWPT